MEYKDYYKTLGVERSASDQEIKKSYRKLAMKFHPDKNPGDTKAEDKFKEINEAYQVLSDPQKRSRYDQLGDSYFNYQQSGGSPGGFNWEQWYNTGQGAGRRVQVDNLGDIFGGGGFSDFFRVIFGDFAAGMNTGGRTAQRTHAPRSMEQPIQISLMEAYNGTTRTIQSGSSRLEVKIPRGAKTGTKVRVPAGSAANMQVDLYLVVEVLSDQRFERKENDLYTDATIDLYTAILGGQVNVSTLSGSVLLTIPPGTQPGQTFRLSGRGMPLIKTPAQHGDLYARIKVTIPRNLSEEDKSVFRKLAGRNQ